MALDADVGGWGERSEAEQENRLSPRVRGVRFYVDGGKGGRGLFVCCREVSTCTGQLITQ